MHHKEWIFSITIILLAIALIVGLVFCGLKSFNPSRLLNETRDEQRINDLAKIKTALDLYIADGQSFDNLETGKIYASNEGSVLANGTGWLPLNLQAISSGAPFKELPVDPLNNKTGNYHIAVNVTKKTYEIDCQLESAKYLPMAKGDGGNNPDLYEIGTDLSLLK